MIKDENSLNKQGDSQIYSNRDKYAKCSSLLNRLVLYYQYLHTSKIEDNVHWLQGEAYVALINEFLNDIITDEIFVKKFNALVLQTINNGTTFKSPETLRNFEIQRASNGFGFWISQIKLACDAWTDMNGDLESKKLFKSELKNCLWHEF